MALPQVNAGAITPQQLQQYQAFTMKEAISTAMSAAKYSFTSNLISKSPLLRNIPGSGILKERSEIKKRELYEKQGRDETGRKLTKQEFEERQKRRMDAGKLKEIHDILLNFLDNGIGTFAVKPKMEGSKQVVIQPGTSVGGAYALQDEEARQEQEREDDQDQLESEQRQQGFFTRLFGGRDRRRNEESGLLGTIFGWLGKLGGSFFEGGISGFIKTLFGPVMTVMTGAMSSILGFIAPLMAAVGPILIAALPAILALLLAGAAGLLVRNWIDSHTEDVEKAAARQGATGLKSENARTAEGEQLFTVTDSTGKKTVKTAKELGLTEKEIAEGTDAETGMFTTKTGELVRAASYYTETEGGKATGRLAMGMNRPEMIEAARRAGAGGSSKLPSDVSGLLQKNITDGKNMAPLIDDIASLNMSMDEYTKTFNSKISAISAPGIGQQLADGYNAVVDEAVRLRKKATKLGLEGEATDILKKLVKNYEPFSRNTSIGYGSFGKKAKYTEEGFITSASLDVPSDDLGGADYRSFSGSYKTPASKIETTTVSQPVAGLSNENAALKNGQTSQPVIINNTTSNSSTTNQATMMNANTARQTGADTSPKFNGSN